MKILTLNFLTCARKTCKSSPAAFPLHPKEAELEQVELEINPLFIKNILPKLDWEAMKQLTQEVRRSYLHANGYKKLTRIQLGLPNLPAETPSEDELVGADGDPSQTLKDLHTLLMETSVASGKLACGSCEHEYAVKEGIANFLLPSHMV